MNFRSVVKKVKKLLYICNWNAISQLPDVSCHMGSHSVICYQCYQVNTTRERSPISVLTRLDVE